MRKIIIAGMFFLALTSFIPLNAQWARTYGGSDPDYAKCIQQTSDGGYIVGGFTNSFGAGGYDIWVLKLNSSGTIEWQRTYGCSDNESDSPIQQTSDGGYIVTGSTQSFGAGGYDFLVLKLSPNGSIDQSCEDIGFIGSSNAIVSDTHISPSNTRVTPVNTNVTPQSTHISPQGTNVISNLICSGKKKGRNRR